MRRALCCAGAFVAWAVPWIAGADTVELTSGTVLQGQIVAEDAESVSIRYGSADGTMKTTRKIPRAQIAKADRDGDASEASSEPPAAAAPADKDDHEEAARPATIEDKPQFLSDAIKQYQEKEYQKAATNLTRLINSCKTDAELKELSARSETEAQKSLAQLAAEVHFELARYKAKGGPIRLELLTKYEMEAVAKKLDDAYSAALNQEIIGQGEPASTAGGADVNKPAREDEAGDRRPGGPLGPVNQRLRRGGPPPGGPGQPPPPGGGPGVHGGGDGGPTVINQPLRISEYKAEPKKFYGEMATNEQLAAFSKHITYTVSLIDARMKVGPVATEETAGDAKATREAWTKKRTDLLAEKKALGELQGVVKSVSRLTPVQRKQRMEAQKRLEEIKQRKERDKEASKSKESSKTRTPSRSKGRSGGN